MKIPEPRIKLTAYQKRLLNSALQGSRLMKSEARKWLRVPRRLLWAFFMEGKETKDMMVTFVRHGRHIMLPAHSGGKGPTEEELCEALAQLKDLPRILPFFICTVVPSPGVTEGYVLLVMTIEKWLGERFRLLPSHFRNIFAKEEPTENKDRPKED